MDTSRRKLREVVVAVVVFTILSTILTYPLALHLGDHLRDDGDSYEYAWNLGFGAYQLTHRPLQLYNGNIFYPFPLSLAYSDSTLPNVLLGTPIILLTDNPILALNLMILLTFILGGLGMYLFVSERTGSRYAALAAGIIYGFSPYRFDHLAQLPNVSMEWVPFALWTFERYVASGRGRWAAGFALTTLLQILVSFYYGIILGIGIGVYVLVRLVQSRALLRRRRWVLQLVGWTGLAVVAAIPAVLPYFQLERMFGLKRTLDEATFFSAWPANYLAATSIMHFVVVEPLVHLVNVMDPTLQVAASERRLYPGTLAVFLAVVALARGQFTRRLAPFLMVVLGIVLSFGPVFHPRNGVDVTLPVQMPYAVLYQYLPGFAALRVPSRFAALAILGLAILAGDGLGGLLASLESRRAITRFRATAISLTGVGCVIFILGESASTIPLTPVNTGANVPPVYRWLAAQPYPSPVVELPIDDNAFHQSPRSYYSTYHHQPLVNGFRSFLPPGYTGLAGILSTFPSRMATDTIERLGVRYVIVHKAELPKSALQYSLRDNPDVRPVAQFGSDDVFEVVGKPPSQDAQLQVAPPCMPDSREPVVMPVSLQFPNSTAVAVLAPGATSLDFSLDWMGQTGTSYQETVQVPVVASILEVPATFTLKFHAPPRPDVYSLTVSTARPAYVNASTTIQLVAVGRGAGTAIRAQPRLALARLPASRGRASDGVPYTLTWQVDTRPAHPEVAFVNLYDDQSRYWSFPVEGEERFDHPPSCAGAFILDSHRLSLKPQIPPGIYRIEAGINDITTGRRMPFTGPDGTTITRLDVGSYRVLPNNVYPNGSLDVGSESVNVFGDAVGLDRPDVAVPPKPGSDISIDLRWISRQRVAVDYTVFIHLTNSSGVVVAQNDHPLGGVVFPTSAWLPGDLLVTQETLSVPSELPAGQYDVKVGLYDLKTMQRLPVVDPTGRSSSDHLTIATVVR